MHDEVKGKCEVDGCWECEEHSSSSTTAVLGTGTAFSTATFDWEALDKAYSELYSKSLEPNYIVVSPKTYAWFKSIWPVK